MQPSLNGNAAPTLLAEYSVEALDVSKRFGANQALSNVTVQIRPASVHGLVGRNGAGKSTLVSVLTGLHTPDTGVVRYDGKPAPATSDREAWREAVACVYQRPTVVPGLTVTENLFLGRLPRGRATFIDWKRARREARAALETWNLDIDLEAKVSELSVEERQVVEIARALLRGSKFMILDEPTAELEARAVTRLFGQIRHLQSEFGISFLYISHHLEEVFELCQEVTVLRDGKLITSRPVSEFTREGLVEAMVGDKARNRPTIAAAPSRDCSSERAPVLRVEDITLAGKYEAISLDVRPGECVGIAGLIGSGKEAVGDTLAGFLRQDSGAIRVAGEVVRPGRTRSAIEAGLGYLPEDRYARGFIPRLGAGENMTLPLAGNSFGRFGFISERRRTAMAKELIERLDIKVSSDKQAVSELSGGNQQKCTLGRAMATKPKVLLLMQPTSGVDIASKDALFASIREAQLAGTAILIITDEPDELQLCQRVLVMLHGRVIRQFDGGFTHERLVHAMEGWNEQD
jgi:simple sugar transport system ATP-binding protein